MDALDERRRALFAGSQEEAVARLDALCSEGRVGTYRIAVAQICPTESRAKEIARGVYVHEEITTPANEGPGWFLDSTFLRTRILKESDQRAILSMTLDQLERLAPERAAKLRERAEKADSSPESRFLAALSGNPSASLSGAVGEALKSALADAVLSWEWVNEMLLLQLLEPLEAGPRPPRLSPKGHGLVDTLGRYLVGALRDLPSGDNFPAPPEMDLYEALEAQRLRVWHREGPSGARGVGAYHLRQTWPSLDSCRVELEHSIPELPLAGAAGLLWIMCDCEDTLYGQVLFVLDRDEESFVHLEVMPDHDEDD